MSVVQVSRATHCATAFSLPETIRDIARLNMLAKMAVGREFLTIRRVSGFTLPVSISNASVSVSWVSAAAATCLHLRLAVRLAVFPTDLVGLNAWLIRWKLRDSLIVVFEWRFCRSYNFCSRCEIFRSRAKCGGLCCPVFSRVVNADKPDEVQLRVWKIQIIKHSLLADLVCL